MESTLSPTASDGSNTWNGSTRLTLLVTGTTVTTPRPSRAAVAFALSLLTITAGRRLLDSLPRTGSRSTSRISPRRIGQSVRGHVLPGSLVTGRRPLFPGARVVDVELHPTQQEHRLVQGRRA